MSAIAVSLIFAEMFAPDITDKFVPDSPLVITQGTGQESSSSEEDLRKRANELFLNGSTPSSCTKCSKVVKPSSLDATAPSSSCQCHDTPSSHPSCSHPCCCGNVVKPSSCTPFLASVSDPFTQCGTNCSCTNSCIDEQLTVFVTGCCGFLGSHVVDYLLAQTQWRVIGIDALSYCATLKNIEEAMTQKDRFTFVKGDFCDYTFMHYLFMKEQPSIIFHIGAYTHVDNSFDNSVAFTRNNTLGTHTLLELCRKFHTRLFLHMSTDEVYGTVPEGHLAKETDEYSPTNPYSVSKVNAENICRTYFDNYGTKMCVIRCNNIIGTRQFVEKLVPKFIMRLLQCKKCCIHGSGETFRNFINVKDVCKALLAVAVEEYRLAGAPANAPAHAPAHVPAPRSLLTCSALSHDTFTDHVWNIGIAEKHSVNEITSKIIGIMQELAIGGDAEKRAAGQYDDLLPLDSQQRIFLFQADEALIEHVPDRIFNDVRYDVDTTKLRERLGITPSIGIDESIRECILWYVAHQDYFNENNPGKFMKPHSH